MREIGSWLRVVGLVLVPALLAAGMPAQSFALFRCQLTGAVLGSCCCAGDEASHDDAPVSSYAPDDCCDVERVDASLPAGVVSTGELAHADFVMLRLEAPAAAPPRALSVASERSASRAREPQRSRAGPSLIIAHRRLLI